MPMDFLSLHRHLVGKSPEWLTTLGVSALSEWLVDLERWQFVNQEWVKFPYQAEMETALADLAALPPGEEREKVLKFLVRKRVLLEVHATPPQELPIDSPPVPEWSDRTRAEAKIRAKRGLSQDKILLGLAILCGGQPGKPIASGDVKRHLRELEMNDLADDATTFLTKLAEAGDLELLPERRSRKETVFELTDAGAKAVEELLI